MSENETRTLVELSLALAAEAFARLAEATQGLAEEDLEAVIDGLLEERDTSDDPNGYEVTQAAISLYAGFLMTIREPSERTSAWDGLESLQKGDLEGARQVAIQLRNQTHTAVDEWQANSDIYYAHMLLSAIHLAEGDTEGAVRELNASVPLQEYSVEDIDPSYLHLLKLVKAGLGDDVLAYLNALSRNVLPAIEEERQSLDSPTGPG